MESLKLSQLAGEIFDQKWNQKIKKMTPKGVEFPHDENYFQSHRNRYFLMLLESNPWEEQNPRVSTLKFTQEFFKRFKEFY